MFCALCREALPCPGLHALVIDKIGKVQTPLLCLPSPPNPLAARMALKWRLCRGVIPESLVAWTSLESLRVDNTSLKATASNANGQMLPSFLYLTG